LNLNKFLTVPITLLLFSKLDDTTLSPIFKFSIFISPNSVNIFVPARKQLGGQEVPEHIPLLHLSLHVFEFPSLQGVPSLKKLSDGQLVSAPVHFSNGLQYPVLALQT
jgi:hypothetical protein